MVSPKASPVVRRHVGAKNTIDPHVTPGSGFFRVVIVYLQNKFKMWRLNVQFQVFHGC